MKSSTILLMLFEVGQSCYAVEARSIVQIVSAHQMTRQEQGNYHPAIVGFLHQSQVVPQATLTPKTQSDSLVFVIDLSALLVKQSLTYQFGTRILSIKDAEGQIWGLMANGMVEMLEVDEEIWQATQQSNATKASSPYSRGTFLHHKRIIHNLNIAPIFRNVNICTY